MDRTDELGSIFKLHGYISDDKIANITSEFINLASVIGSEIKHNEKLLARLGKLIDKKEFSNDPSTQIGELSDIFQTKLMNIKRDIESLKRAISTIVKSKTAGQQHMFYSHILDTLQKSTSKQIETFQSAIEVHQQQVQERQKRVTKFGAAPSVIPALGAQPKSTYNIGNSTSYALFGGGNIAPSPSSSSSNAPSSILRKRTNHAIAPPPSHPSDVTSAYASPSGTAHPYPHQPAMMNQELKAPVKSRARLNHLEQVQSSISELGKLFSQMNNLVMAQSETIMRIEDDVESGLMDTQEAHKSMEHVYELTKGNRSLIFQIFGLLVFFIFVFLVWT